MKLLRHLTLLTCLASAQNERPAQSEVPAVRTYFYVGGGYSDDGKGGHIFKDQMYVEKLSPALTEQDVKDPISRCPRTDCM